MPTRVKLAQRRQKPRHIPLLLRRRHLRVIRRHGMQKGPGRASEDFDVWGTVGRLSEVGEGFGGGAFCLGEGEEVAEGGAGFTWFAVLVEDYSRW
jgi:hypothetical protein